jgi:ABC-type nitrate/sulfonate/bicarbonate transport system ATPase subunit
MDTPNGSYKRIDSPVVMVQNKPYYVSAEHEAIMKFIELYLTKNKNVLLIGDGTCGKSDFMTYIRENLG